jgi:hypothetical protein
LSEAVDNTWEFGTHFISIILLHHHILIVEGA